MPAVRLLEREADAVDDRCEPREMEPHRALDDATIEVSGPVWNPQQPDLASIGMV